MVYQLFKDGIPVAIAHTAEEADELYLKYDCDECRGISIDDKNNQKGECE